jgi:hypothetical protein
MSFLAPIHNMPLPLRSTRNKRQVNFRLDELEIILLGSLANGRGLSATSMVGQLIREESERLGLIDKTRFKPVSP